MSQIVDSSRNKLIPYKVFHEQSSEIRKETSMWYMYLLKQKDLVNQQLEN